MMKIKEMQEKALLCSFWPQKWLKNILNMFMFSLVSAQLLKSCYFKNLVCQDLSIYHQILVFLIRMFL